MPELHHGDAVSGALIESGQAAGAHRETDLRCLHRLHPVFLREVPRRRPTCHLQPPKTLSSLRGAASCARYGETAPLVNLETVPGPIISISPLVTVNVRGGGGGGGKDGEGGGTGTTRGFPRRTVGSGFDARRCSIHHLRPLHLSLCMSCCVTEFCEKLNMFRRKMSSRSASNRGTPLVGYWLWV